LQFADVADGELTVIPRAIFAVAAVLMGARGGADIPAADLERVKTTVGQYYADMRRQFEDEAMIPPWDKSVKSGRAISKANGARIMSAIAAVQEAVNTLQALLSEAGIDLDAEDVLDAVTDGGEPIYVEPVKSTPSPEGRDLPANAGAGPSATPTPLERERLLLEIETLTI
jgi:hypothetical protein